MHDEVSGKQQTLEEMRLRVMALERLATLGELLGGVMHEVKNPISFISNFAELSLSSAQELKELIAQTPAQGEQRTQLDSVLADLKSNLEQIVAQSARVSSLIQHMLSQMKDGSNRFTLTDINKLLDESAMLTYHGMRAKNANFNVKFQKDYDPNLPSFYAFEEGIDRVFLNIFNNAYFAMMVKKEKLGDAYQPLLTISSKKIDGSCEVRIRDNGEGIPQANRAKIFTPFYTTKEPSQGTGLGLSLSKNVIETIHKGSLAFDSEEGQFTEFILTLPIMSPKQ